MLSQKRKGPKSQWKHEKNTNLFLVLGSVWSCWQTDFNLNINKEEMNMFVSFKLEETCWKDILEIDKQKSKCG